MSALLAVIERAAETNLLLAEDYLARNAVGDEGLPTLARRLQRAGTLGLRLRRARRRSTYRRVAGRREKPSSFRMPEAGGARSLPAVRRALREGPHKSTPP